MPATTSSPWAFMQELPVKLVVANSGVTREANTGAAGVAQVAVDHGLDVDRGTQHVVNIVDAAVVLARSFRHERNTASRDITSCSMRVLREIILGVLLNQLLVFLDDFLQRLGIEFGIELGFFLMSSCSSKISSKADLGISSTTLPNIWIKRR